MPHLCHSITIDNLMQWTTTKVLPWLPRLLITTNRYSPLAPTLLHRRTVNGKQHSFLANNTGKPHRQTTRFNLFLTPTPSTPAALSRLHPSNPQLQKDLAPQDAAGAAARQAISAQERELLTSHSALLAARRLAGEKDAALRAAKQEAWHLKHLAARQGQLLDSFSGELFYVS